MKSLGYIFLIAFLLIGWGVMDAQQGSAYAQRNQAGADKETQYQGAGSTAKQRARRNSMNSRFSNEERPAYRSQNKGRQHSGRNSMGTFRHTQHKNMQGNRAQFSRTRYHASKNGKHQTVRHGQGIKKGSRQGYRRGL